MKRFCMNLRWNWKAGFFLAGLILVVLVPPGCVERKRLSALERARLIKKNRTDAADLLAKYKASLRSNEENVDFLYQYLALHQENVELAPSTCPRCWAEYGEALSMLGWVWWYSYEDIVKELEQKNKAGASRSELESLEEEAGAHREEWVRYFTQSNRAYENHFREVLAVHPYSFERVMRHYEILGDYKQALFYLDKTEKSYPEFFQRKIDEKTRRKFDVLRKSYGREANLQEERKVRGEEIPPYRRTLREEEPPSRSRFNLVPYRDRE